MMASGWKFYQESEVINDFSAIGHVHSCHFSLLHYPFVCRVVHVLESSRPLFWAQLCHSLEILGMFLVNRMQGIKLLCV